MRQARSGFLVGLRARAQSPPSGRPRRLAVTGGASATFARPGASANRSAVATLVPSVQDLRMVVACALAFPGRFGTPPGTAPICGLTVKFQEVVPSIQLEEADGS